MSIFELLEQQRREINEQIKTLKAELQDIDIALSAIANKNSASEMKLNAPNSSMPIDSAVIESVKNGQQSPINIHAFIGRELGIQTTINSVRTRLSRLKKAGQLSRDDGGWILPRNNETPTDEKSEGVSGSTDDGDGTPSSLANGGASTSTFGIPSASSAHPGDVDPGRKDNP